MPCWMMCVLTLCKIIARDSYRVWLQIDTQTDSVRRQRVHPFDFVDEESSRLSVVLPLE